MDKTVVKKINVMRRVLDQHVPLSPEGRERAAVGMNPENKHPAVICSFRRPRLVIEGGGMDNCNFSFLLLPPELGGRYPVLGEAGLWD